MSAQSCYFPCVFKAPSRPAYRSCWMLNSTGLFEKFDVATRLKSTHLLLKSPLCLQGEGGMYSMCYFAHSARCVFDSKSSFIAELQQMFQNLKEKNHKEKAKQNAVRHTITHIVSCYPLT
ncbi:hypothetical protein CRENBAI_005735 [Crenichthys baileyi]|uniref:Uncharacterized protein n=1 Tax=Crenichthys baileyi TaxID=28760 RepID=A0AAV9R0T0_9TELE